MNLLRGSKCHSLNGCYGLRRNAAPSKCFQDYHVEGLSFSKKKCTQAMTAGVKGDRFTVQAPHLPVSNEATINSGRAPLILRIKRTGPPGSRCEFISELVFPSMQEGFIGGSKPAQPLISGEEQADVQEINTGERPLVAKEKYGVSKTTLEETREVSSILLGLGQHVPQQNTIQQIGSTAQGAPVVQKKKNREHQDHTYCRVHTQGSTINGHVEIYESKGQRKKQANPCHVIHREVHVQQDGDQRISRSGLDTQPGDRSSHTTSCETQGRRRKQASPRHAMTDADGRVWMSVSYCSPTMKPHAPVIDANSADVKTVQMAGSTAQGAPAVPKRKLRVHEDHTYCKVRPQESAINGRVECCEIKVQSKEQVNPCPIVCPEVLIQALRVQQPWQQSISTSDHTQPSAMYGHVGNCETKTQRRKQANPCRIVPREVQIQALHIQQAGDQRISRSGLDIQPGDSKGHVANCETQRRRRKQASPRHAMTDADGRVWMSVSYCSSILKRHSPVPDVDNSEELMSGQPKRKRARR
ncbi:uncharacterized protein LOC134448506 [Engraulis encrasicolus]|uniref:uncharacterized protein LOC134448506 n=1 Tax=Engraulis encrasicolus TaxID=184585 RepID=UPI002FD36E2E